MSPPLFTAGCPPGGRRLRRRAAGPGVDGPSVQSEAAQVELEHQGQLLASAARRILDHQRRHRRPESPATRSSPRPPGRGRPERPRAAPGLPEGDLPLAGWAEPEPRAPHAVIVVLAIAGAWWGAQRDARSRDPVSQEECCLPVPGGAAARGPPARACRARASTPTARAAASAAAPGRSASAAPCPARPGHFVTPIEGGFQERFAERAAYEGVRFRGPARSWATWPPPTSASSASAATTGATCARRRSTCLASSPSGWRSPGLHGGRPAGVVPRRVVRREASEVEAGRLAELRRPDNERHRRRPPGPAATSWWSPRLALPLRCRPSTRRSAHGRPRLDRGPAALEAAEPVSEGRGPAPDGRRAAEDAGLYVAPPVPQAGDPERPPGPCYRSRAALDGRFRLLGQRSPCPRSTGGSQGPQGPSSPRSRPRLRGRAAEAPLVCTRVYTTRRRGRTRRLRKGGRVALTNGAEITLLHPGGGAQPPGGLRGPGPRLPRP